MRAGGNALGHAPNGKHLAGAEMRAKGAGDAGLHRLCTRTRMHQLERGHAFKINADSRQYCVKHPIKDRQLQVGCPYKTRGERERSLQGTCPMTYSRKNLVSLRDTPYYHVVARCVRRAWLWGFDEYAGQDYSHRKDWVVERLGQLASLFAIEVCAYAVMSNHYHLVVYVDQARAKRFTREEVASRWTQLFRAPAVVRRYLENETSSDEERQLAESIIDRWRDRLFDISWFMKCLNEHLARRANAEDGCSGRFWEGRFRSQALLDEAGLLTAMTYVDLNPIRAGIAKTPETSEFTSVCERIQRLRSDDRSLTDAEPRSHVRLRPFSSAGSDAHAIPYRIDEYLQLVDWSGRMIRSDKPGHIDTQLPPIACRLHIDVVAWQSAMRPRSNVFGRAMGRLDHLRLHAKTLGQSWVRGLARAEQMYGA